MVQLILTMDDQGKFNVSGPIKDKTLSYGMLGLAHDAIHDYHVAQAQQVQPATPADLALIKPKN